MLYIVDYQIPRTEELDCIVVEADDYDSAMKCAISELKILKIPRRYIIKLEEVK